MSVIGRLVVSIVGNNTELKKSLQDTDKLLSKQTKNINYIADQMGKAGKIMTLGVTLPIMGIGVAFGKMAMEAVESESLFEVSMGSMADSARKWSEQLSDSLGLNQYELRKTAGVFNVMFDSMGLAEEASYNMSTSLTELAYDMASFYNLNTEDAIQKLQAGITGEAEPLKRLGIIINETTVYQTALREGIIQTGEQMTEQEKVQARYRTIMDQTAKAQGDLARTIESPANQLRVLKDQVKETAISFGEFLLPAISDILGGANNMVAKFKNMDDPTKKLVVNIALIAAGAGPALMALGGLTKAIIGLRNAYNLLNTSMATSSLTKMLSGTASFLAQFGAYTPAIGAFVEDMGLLKQATGELNVIMNNMKGQKFANYFWVPGKEGAKNNDLIYEQIDAIQNLAQELSTASPEIQARALELNEAFNKSPKALEDFRNLSKGLYELSQVQEDTTGTTDKQNIIIEEQIKLLEEQGYTTEKATELAKEYAKSLGYETEEIEEQKEALDKLIESIHAYYNLNQSTTEATWDYQDALKNLNEVNKNANATEREKQEAIFGVQDALENLEIAMAKEYEDTETSIDRKKELAELYITAGLNAVEAGAMSESAFMKMAETYGFTAGEILKKADELDIKLDWVTRERFIHISHNVNQVESEVDKLYNKLKQIDGMNVTFKMVQTGLMSAYANGGIIGYANGGIANKVLSASSGMITPSYDNGGILSLLHKNEVVLNSKQTRNLAELIFGLANTRFADSQEYGNTGQPLIIKNVIELDGSIIYEKTEEHLYRSQRLKQIGAGIR